MITVELPSDAEIATRVAAEPPETRAQVERTIRHQIATVRFACSLPDLTHFSQVLDALLGGYGTLILSSSVDAQATQDAANHMMRLSMSLASRANTKRQQEAQATAAFGPGAMPTSPHTH